MVMMGFMRIDFSGEAFRTLRNIRMVRVGQTCQIDFREQFPWTEPAFGRVVAYDEDEDIVTVEFRDNEAEKARFISAACAQELCWPLDA